MEALKLVLSCRVPVLLLQANFLQESSEEFAKWKAWEWRLSSIVMTFYFLIANRPNEL